MLWRVYRCRSDTAGPQELLQCTRELVHASEHSALWAKNLSTSNNLEFPKPLNYKIRRLPQLSRERLVRVSLNEIYSNTGTATCVLTANVYQYTLVPLATNAIELMTMTCDQQYSF